jgi:hypothetical protein
MIHQFEKRGPRESNDVVKILLNYIINYYRQQLDEGITEKSKLYPTKDEIKKQLNLSENDINFLFYELKNKGSNEKLIYSFYNPEEIKPPVIDNLMPVKNKVITGIKNIIGSIQDNSKNKKPIFLMFQVMIFLAFISFFYEGVKNVYEGNLLFTGIEYKIDSFICAFMFLCMGIVCFDMAIFYAIRKKKALFFLFIFLFSVLFIFNAGMILYFKNHIYKDKILLSSEKVQSIKDSSKYKDILKSISEKEKDKMRIQSDYDRNNKILSSLNRDDKEYGFYFWRIDKLDKDINSKSDEIDRLIIIKNQIESSSNIIKNSNQELFTGWILNFFLFLPSFLMELFASISLALLLFIKLK